VDLGFVGEVEEINTDIIHVLIREGYIPVVSSVAVGREGESYNVNADHVAGELAGALEATKLVMLTDVQGVYSDINDKTSLISSLTRKQAREMITSGQIAKGMIPKIEACVIALDSGVEKTHIIDGTIPHALLMEIFTEEGIGTMME
jgi:acetylglutamate kinase